MSKQKLSKEEIKKGFDSLSGWYDSMMSLPEFFLIRNYRENHVAKASGRILEIGVGTGNNLQYYSPGSTVTAIDLSEDMIEKAKEKFSRKDISVEFCQMDAEHLELPDNSFDTVVDSLNLCLFPDPIKALTEMKRVCKEDGQFFFIEHGKSSSNLIENIQEKGAGWWHNMAHGCHWDREHDKLVQDAGLNIESFSRRLFGIIYIIKAVPDKTD